MTTQQLLKGDTRFSLFGKGLRDSILLVGIVFTATLMLDTASAQQTEGLELPDDIAARSALGQPGDSSDSEDAEPDVKSFNGDRKYYIEERRIGGRLERVTVRRKNGLDEVYENPEVDSMWVTEDKELGELQNVRRWTIGSW